jgi:programmed cell death 6-interacting protein
MPTAQTVMLAIHCKRTENVELKAPILQYVREAYSDRDADDAADDLAAVQTLRNELVLAQSGSQGMLRDSLCKYFRALTAIEARFPISSDREHVRLSFTWADAFRPNKKAAQSNVHFEKAAVLFNVAAVLSQQALQVERGTGEGITQACRLFQEAAGCFALLRETEAAKCDASPKPVDLSPECCSMLERLMLAQAQECVLHKASQDRKSPGTQARLAKQAAGMYGEVAALFAAPALASHFEKSWAVESSGSRSVGLGQSAPARPFPPPPPPSPPSPQDDAQHQHTTTLTPPTTNKKQQTKQTNTKNKNSPTRR